MSNPLIVERVDQQPHTAIFAPCTMSSATPHVGGLPFCVTYGTYNMPFYITNSNIFNLILLIVVFAFFPPMKTLLKMWLLIWSFFSPLPSQNFFCFFSSHFLGNTKRKLRCELGCRAKAFLQEVLKVYSSKYMSASRMLGDQLALAWVVMSGPSFDTRKFTKPQAFLEKVGGASVLFLPCAEYNWTPPEGAGQFHGMPLDVKVYCNIITYDFATI